MPHKRNPIGCEQIDRPRAARSRQRDGGARERRALARARHLALVGRARDSARQLHRARSHAAPLHENRRRHGRVPGADDGESAAIARRRVFGHRAARAGASAASRASRRTSGCSATRCGRFTSSATSRTLLLADADVAAALPRAVLDEAFDLDAQLRHVDAIFRRRVRRRGREPPRTGAGGVVCCREQ